MIFLKNFQMKLKQLNKNKMIKKYNKITMKIDKKKF